MSDKFPFVHVQPFQTPVGQTDFDNVSFDNFCSFGSKVIMRDDSEWIASLKLVDSDLNGSIGDTDFYIKYDSIGIIDLL